MSPDELVRRFFSEGFNDGRTDAVEVFIHADHRNHDPTALEAGRSRGRALPSGAVPLCLPLGA
jgi:hypothetical protein